MKRSYISIIFVLLLMMMVLAACGGNKTEQTYSVIQDNEFGNVYLDVSIEDFTAAGFQLGDSCDVHFSNGLSLEDIPFYNGFYVRYGMPVVVAYPGYEHIAVSRKSQGLWPDSGLTENDTATVTLRKSGKYLNEQETFSQSHSDNIGDYRDEEQFANFRALSGGSLKDDFLYRGASPVDNQHNRASVVDALLEKNGIRFVLDLADSDEKYLGYREEAGFSSHYAAGLYDADCMALLDMSADYASDDFKQKLASGLKKILSSEGPVFIHCMEGKDRTGFVCCLLEALAGASYDEMLDDYMMTYEDYYGITKQDSPEKYDAIASLYFDELIAFLHGTEEHGAAGDYTQDAVNYLLDSGMTEQELYSLRNMISKG